MVRNYYTLVKVAEEIRKLTGWKVLGAFTQEKSQLVIEITNGSNLKYLIFNSDGKYDSFYINDKFNRAKKNTLELLHDLNDEVIQNSVIVGKNRIIKIEFSNLNAYFQLFGGEYSNIFITNFDNKIFDSFKQSDTHFGKYYSISNDELPEFFDMPSNMKIIEAMASSSLLLGKFYSGIILYKNGIEPETTISQLNAKQLKDIHDEAENLIKSLQSATEYYVLEHPTLGLTFSLINDNISQVIFKSSNISETIRKTLITELRSGQFSQNHNKIVTKLKSIIERNKRKTDVISNLDALRERAENYRKLGELLMAQPDLKQKKGSKIILNDADNNSITVLLDSRLNLLENAEKYFSKSKHSIAEIENRQKRLPNENQKIDNLESLLKELLSLETNDQLSDFINKNKRILEMENIEQGQKQATRFREFELGENYKLFLGRNAANNDELTMKFAKPNDLWLHARGTSGSHAVIKMNKEEKPPKHILQKAAEITAYYSGARNAKYVPVVYTFKKYVRKPKGANIGAVVISKEDVIMAEPKLPEA